MINFSKTGLIGDLIKEVEALSAGSVFEARAKESAVLMLRDDSMARAHINLRCNVLTGLGSQQLEIQVTGKVK